MAKWMTFGWPKQNCYNPHSGYIDKVKYCYSEIQVNQNEDLVIYLAKDKRNVIIQLNSEFIAKIDLLIIVMLLLWVANQTWYKICWLCSVEIEPTTSIFINTNPLYQLLYFENNI